MGERCTVEGTVQTVIFQNEENGYTVLPLTVDGQEAPVPVVGCIPCAAPGEELILTGAPARRQGRACPSAACGWSTRPTARC